MRSKVRYQLLDASNSPKLSRNIWLFLFIVCSVIAVYTVFFKERRSAYVYGKMISYHSTDKTSLSGQGSETPKTWESGLVLLPDKQNPMTYEKIMDELREEIKERNQIIDEMQKDFKKLDIKTDFVSGRIRNCFKQLMKSIETLEKQLFSF